MTLCKNEACTKHPRCARSDKQKFTENEKKVNKANIISFNPERDDCYIKRRSSK